MPSGRVTANIRELGWEKGVDEKEEILQEPLRKYPEEGNGKDFRRWVEYVRHLGSHAFSYQV